ncbi:Asp23/Gls24 family envelope stress response protein [Microbispora amethystogenes]|uniref:Asp23/Gls24 family envelope stress response protein n=1 Tax=Microbispora amethystogenes TaxID=1427754 RepID=A0ABQ4FNG3_9ACTN|nr:Asp23/Gls24 family envelope stress response protein [Microbispora amethystogenes]GIH36356.1 hypothetical protein Mam01_65200 [Microbispora amethystogenes]
MSLPAERGTTTISERALTKIVERVVGEEEHVTEPPHVSASLSGMVAAVRCDVTIRYPSPVPRVAGEIRERVRRRVRELTGVAVENVDIEVVGLVPEQRSGDERRRRPV